MKSQSKTVKRPAKGVRQSRRSARETPARYKIKPPSGISVRRPRWKIPLVTPVSDDEPVRVTLPRAVKRIAETLHPEKIILFGSYAYGTPTPDSDVDLLVVMETSASDTDRYLTVSRLLRPRPFAVDILVRTPQEIETALEKGDFFIDEIVSRGKVLYARHNPSP